MCLIASHGISGLLSLHMLIFKKTLNMLKGARIYKKVTQIIQRIASFHRLSEWSLMI